MWKLVSLLLICLVSAGIVLAQDAEATEDHNAHHPETEATEAPADQSTGGTEDAGGGMGSSDGMMQAMTGMSMMMDSMMQMDMSDEMRAHMGEMRGMMDSMMEMSPDQMGQMMGQMHGMMQEMAAMDMPNEMRAPMGMMMGMMNMMQSGMMGGMMQGGQQGQMQGGQQGQMQGMNMNAPGPVDQFAPFAHGLYNGEDVYFIHTEASDEGVAAMLTDMMGPQVVAVPGLANIPAESLGNVYVFTNGVEGGGPMGFQADVFDSVPGDANYSPLRAVNLVTWAEGIEPRELTSLADIEAAESAGEIMIEQPGVVVVMPILAWGGGQR